MQIKVIREEPVDPPVKEVVLTLTEREAVMLGALTGATNMNSPASDMYKILAADGFGYGHPDYNFFSEQLKRA